MDFDLLDSGLMSRIINEIESSESIDRKTREWDSYQIFSGNLQAYTLEELQRTRPKSWKSYTVSNISVSKMVVSKLAKSYKQSPKRDLGNDDKTELYNTILKQANAERQFREFDEIYNLHRDALYWVNWRQKEARYQFMSLAQYEFDTIRNKDTGELEVVILKYPDTTITHTVSQLGGDGKADLIQEAQSDEGGQSKVYAIWSKHQHVVIKVVTERISEASGVQIKKSIEYVPIDDNPSNVNPLGVLPFVYKSQSTSVGYPTPNPIKDQTTTFNALWSELLTTANIQGAGILKFKFPEKMQGQFDQMSHGLTTALELPQSSDPDDSETDAEYISPSPALAEQKDVYISYLSQVLSEHGISSSSGIAGGIEKFSSGLERMIAQADVQGIIQENQNCYTDLEQEVFEIVKAWDQLLGFNDFSKEDELSIIYPKPKVLISDIETLATIEKRLSLGLIEKWEALVILDPNMTETTAKAKLKLIDEEKKKNMEDFIGNEMDLPNESRPVESSTKGSDES